MYKRCLIALGVCLCAVALFVSVQAKNEKETPAESPTETPVPAISLDKGLNEYDALLGEYVDEMGFVDYKTLKENREKFDNFLAALSQVTSDQYDAMSENEQIALWINAYNALTLDAILDHYPIKATGLSAWRFPKNSIRQIGGVWDKLKWQVAGREVSLGDIEHEILRKKFKEPRIHVAIVCASYSCPPLRDEAYRADKLDAQLTDQAKKFVRNNENFRIDRTVNIVYLSSIFDWFGKDFVEKYGTDKFQGSKAERAVLNFAVQYISDSDKQFLEAASYKIKFVDYNWSLNEQQAD